MFEECPNNNNLRWLRRHRRGCTSKKMASCKQHNTCHDDFFHNNKRHHHQDDMISTPTHAAAVAAESNLRSNYNKRPTKPRLRQSSTFRITKSRYIIFSLQQYLFLTLLLLNTITLTQQQGITIGNVLNLENCYAAMQNSQTNNKISREEYVPFIQELANNQFKSFQFDSDSNTWGNFPTTDFNLLPEQVRQEFNKHACGGGNIFCSEAFLYTNGTKPNDPVPPPQQEVYLYQVCVGVENAIEETLPKTEKPTSSPTPPVTVVGSSEVPSSTPTIANSSPVVKETVLLNYQITVPPYITEGAFQNGDNSESEELKEALLEAVQTWMQNMASDLSRVGKKKKQQKKMKQRGRVLAVTIDPNAVQFTNVTTGVCNTEPVQMRDQCLDIQMAIPLELTGNQSLTPEEIKLTIQAKFEEALRDGSFYSSLPPEVLEHISGVSPQPISKIQSPPVAAPTPTPPPTVVAPNAPPQPPVNPQISIQAPVPAPAPSPNVGGIVGGIVVGLCVVIVGFFVNRRRQEQKKQNDNTDTTPSFGKRESNDFSYTRGILSAFAPKRKDIQSDDLEYGQDPIRDDSSDGSGSMESYSSHSSSGSDSSSYYSTSGSSSRTGHSENGPASVSASSASSYDTPPDNIAQPVDTSMTSGKSSSSSEKDKTAPAQLYDLNDSEGSSSNASDTNALLSDEAKTEEASAKGDGAVLAPDYLEAKDRVDADDDSSAGSSGWESSDGDSSVRTGSVDSFDPNAESLGTSISPSHDGTSTYAEEEEMEDRQLMPDSLNPAVNPVIQRGVTMIPVDEGDEDEDSTYMSDDSDNPLQNRTDVAPMARDLDRAIEAGDWAAVGATAAILASDSERDDDSAIRSTGVSTKSASMFSSGVSTSSYSGATEYTDESGLDAARAAEIDQLVETGNWDGVVAVAARYADDASMTSGVRKHSKRDDDSHHSDASASVESARSYLTGNTRGSKSSSGGSKGSTLVSGESSGSSKSPSSSSKSHSGSPKEAPAAPREEKEEDMNTHASSITSSYVSRSGISSSMLSNTSTMSHEKQQMNMYRAEVEALVRRVVPDEIDNIDDIMVQFSGREEELIETLKAMQEKSIAQRARAAVQRTAKREKGVTGRSSSDESSEDYSQSQDASANPTVSSGQSSNYSSAYTSSGAGDSITADFAGMSNASSYYSHPSAGSSYLSRDDGSSHSGSDSGYSTHSGEYTDDHTREDSYVTTEHHDDGTGASSLSGAVDASDWRAMGIPAEMLGEKTPDNKDPLDELLSEADRASGRNKIDP